ncbi:tetratricopeptide repeat protein [Massilia sp. YMA4]|uniref:tetratricopeptide repeat protein n=1 Tax=Massilia sp. YMA4 TaxID=1593482 RepID=UPI000DD1229A|nr:tetratricopeptide repeat protein [Massilia sp. YMA4]AXA94090.1 tetratricopeptide repeat protein [Massilia sp. YMA4]
MNVPRRFLALCAGLLLAAAARAQVPVPTQLPEQLPLPPLDTAQKTAEPDLYVQALRAIGDGRRDKAGVYLARLEARVGDDPAKGNPGDWLDLAMLHCAMGNEEQALRLFDIVEREFTPPPALMDIIAQQRSRGCYRWKPLRQWSVTAGRGHDSNVNQGASSPVFELSGGPALELLPEYLPHADSYATVSADYMAELTEAGDVAFAQVYTRRHDSMDAFDTVSLYGGIDHPWRIGDWRVRGTATIGALWLDNTIYHRQGQLQLRVTPPLPLPPNIEASVLGGVSRLSYNLLNNFDSVTTELRGILRYRGERWQGQASAAVLEDHALGTRPGGDRHGWNAMLFGRVALGGKLEGEMDLSRQEWRGASAYSPGLINLTRHQRTLAGRAALIYPLGGGHSVQLEVRRVLNHENISLFKYDSSQVLLSWNWRDSR